MTRARSAGWLVLITLALVSAALVPVATSPAAPSTGKRAYIVRSGDTLSGIAKQHAVTVASLVRANRLVSDKIRLRIGTRLVVPEPSESAKTSSSGAIAPTARGGRRGASTTATRRSRMPANIVLAIPEFEEPVPGFGWPIEGGISSNFGRRRLGWHCGIDIIAPLGTPIAAAAPGLVVASGVEGRYGRVVKLAHESGFVSVYAHHTENLVELGTWVSAGQAIATVGRSGRATAEHLHFEIRREGFAYNPLYLLPLPSHIVPADEQDIEEDDEHD